MNKLYPCQKAMKENWFYFGDNHVCFHCEVTNNDIKLSSSLLHHDEFVTKCIREDCLGNCPYLKED